MSTLPSSKDFGTVYSEFITVLGEIAQKAIEERSSAGGQQVPIPAPLEAVLAEVQSPAAIFAVNYAASQIDPTTRNLLSQELEFISSIYGGGNAQGTQKAVDDGEAGKDSVLDLLDTWLPDWLKKLLKILDEILSLLRPG